MKPAPPVTQMIDPPVSSPLDVNDLASLQVLARGFYQRPTADVARDLLGKLLLRATAAGLVAARILEVEAYLGPQDRACHTFGGRRTERVRSMWGEAGHAYVYLIYGLHHCLNIVTVGGGAGEAVLVRGAAIVHGLDVARRRRGDGVADGRLADGPGKLCQALGIDRDDDGRDLCQPARGLWLGDDGWPVEERLVRRTPRIGVGYAGPAARWPLRFVLGPH